MQDTCILLWFQRWRCWMMRLLHIFCHRFELLLFCRGVSFLARLAWLDEALGRVLAIWASLDEALVFCILSVPERSLSTRFYFVWFQRVPFGVA